MLLEVGALVFSMYSKILSGGIRRKNDKAKLPWPVRSLSSAYKPTSKRAYVLPASLASHS
jgi:hypothetical protein